MQADMICVDWKVDMAVARQTLGADVRVSGNVDPLVLLGPENKVRARAVASGSYGVWDASCLSREDAWPGMRRGARVRIACVGTCRVRRELGA